METRVRLYTHPRKRLRFREDLKVRGRPCRLERLKPLRRVNPALREAAWTEGEGQGCDVSKVQRLKLARQKTTLRAICRTRAGPVPPICPAEALPMDAFGTLKLAWLKALNISNR